MSSAGQTFIETRRIRSTKKSRNPQEQEHSGLCVELAQKPVNRRVKPRDKRSYTGRFVHSAEYSYRVEMQVANLFLDETEESQRLLWAHKTQ